MGKSEKEKQRRKNHSITQIPESKKRHEPKRSNGTIYNIPSGERKVFHLEVENKSFDPKSGKKLSTPYVVKLDGVQEYRQYVQNAFKSGYEHRILHDPRPYLGMTKDEIKAQDKEFLRIAGNKTHKAK